MNKQLIKIFGSIIFIDGIVSMIIGSIKEEKSLNVLRAVRSGIGLYMMQNGK